MVNTASRSRRRGTVKGKLPSSTVPPLDRAGWLQWRRSGIGGSDAAAVVGLDPFRSPLSVYLDKVGLLPLDGREESSAMRWGQLLEPVIAEEFETETGLYVVGRQAQLVHPEHAFLRATLDGFIDERPDAPDDEQWPNPLGIYEAKSTGFHASDWTEGVPDGVAVQAQHNLAVSGLDRAWVAALLTWPTPRLVIHQLDRDEAAIATLLEIEHDFWQRVQERRPPPADSMASTADALKSAYRNVDAGTTIELTPAALGLVRAREKAAREERAWAERKQTAENGLMAFLGNAETGFLNGKVVVTWSPVERRTIDLDALRAKHPKIAERLTRVATSRRFSFKNVNTIHVLDEEEEAS